MFLCHSLLIRSKFQIQWVNLKISHKVCLSYPNEFAISQQCVLHLSLLIPYLFFEYAFLLLPLYLCIFCLYFYKTCSYDPINLIGPSRSSLNSLCSSPWCTVTLVNGHCIRWWCDKTELALSSHSLYVSCFIKRSYHSFVNPISPL